MPQLCVFWRVDFTLRGAHGTRENKDPYFFPRGWLWKPLQQFVTAGVTENAAKHSKETSKDLEDLRKIKPVTRAGIFQGKLSGTTLEQEEWDLKYCEYCCLAVTKLTFVWLKIDLTTPYVIRYSFTQRKTLSFTSIKKLFCLMRPNGRQGVMLMREGLSEGPRLPSADVKHEKANLGVTAAAHRRRMY